MNGRIQESVARSQQALPVWLRALYPFEPKNFTTPRGAHMSFIDEGPRSDEAVLMLHGNPTWSFYFRNLVQELAPRIRCIAPDHVGMGLSDKLENYDYPLVTRIDDIEALIMQFGLRRVYLIMHDWGGAIGFGLAARRPRLIGKFVILNTAAFAVPWIPWRIALCRTKFPGTLLVRGLNGFAGPATRMAMRQRKLSADEKRAYLWPYRSWADRVAIDAFVKDIPLEETHPSMGTLREIESELPRFRDRPALITWGGKDFCFDNRFFARWREIFPQAQIEEYPDAGHYVLEDAGVAIRSRIANFFMSSATL
ncbi:MAG: alpha/beta fold hydrolase [Verrucomicrobiota bacterium]|nr:alpha/beta fold hydrolase [Verrucomicrobiota bacterium]